MGLQWSWGSALIGAATTTAAAVALLSRPKDPTFYVASISLASFKLNLPLLDVELTLTVHISNPNPVPILYDPATISIYYAGTHLGSAQVEAGSQAASSCQILTLPARLDGVQLAHHAARLLFDAARREMELYATVDIPGVACLLWWRHRFSIHVDSHILVDPIFLQVIQQENHSETHLSLA